MGLGHDLAQNQGLPGRSFRHASSGNRIHTRKFAPWRDAQSANAHDDGRLKGAHHAGSAFCYCGSFGVRPCQLWPRPEGRSWPSRSGGAEGGSRSGRRPRAARSARATGSPRSARASKPDHPRRPRQLPDIGKLRDRLSRKRNSGHGVLRPDAQSGDIRRRTASDLWRGSDDCKCAGRCGMRCRAAPMMTISWTRRCRMKGASPPTISAS